MELEKNHTELNKMDQITELKNKRNENVETINRLLKENEQITRELYKLEFGIEIGTIVVGKDGKKYKITSITTGYNRLGKPWVKAYPSNKDGSFSQKQKLIYEDWELDVE